MFVHFISDINARHEHNIIGCLGHPELIDKMIPKTPKELEEESKQKQKSLSELYSNMTKVLRDINDMKHDIEVNRMNITQLTDEVKMTQKH